MKRNGTQQDESPDERLMPDLSLIGIFNVEIMMTTVMQAPATRRRVRQQLHKLNGSPSEAPQRSTSNSPTTHEKSNIVQLICSIFMEAFSDEQKLNTCGRCLKTIYLSSHRRSTKHSKYWN